MSEGDYIELVFLKNLIEGEDIPDRVAHIITIVATQFFHNKIPITNACLFTKLLLYLESEKCKYVLSFIYSPLDVLKRENDFLWEYTYEQCRNVETVGLILMGNKHLLISQRELLTIEKLNDRIKAFVR